MPDGSGKASDPLVVVRAAWEMLVFAPIGLGAKFVDDAPGAIKRVRQELSNARFIGRLTVEQGAARLRAQATADLRSDRSGNDRSVIDGDLAPGQSTDGESAPVDGPDTFPIEGYDEMPAIEIVGRLEALGPAQRAEIDAHERANRQRRTVLGKLAQLAQ